ncbi:MAG: DUF1343 domain-containing protein [Elusimicrobiota bacterium]
MRTIVVITIASLTFLMGSSPAAAAPVEKTPVLFGIDNLKNQQFAPLKGKQVGLITNQTGVSSRGPSTADLLAKVPGVKLIALFSPEHGIRGTSEHGQPIGDTVDPKIHLPVYSLYGATQRPLPEMLNAMDVLIFDMQDVGVRYYTYLATMGMAMEAVAKRGITFMVLDRPNPLGGAIVEGQVLDPRIRHFTAYYSIPVRHGFTAGELAGWYNKTANLNANLQVIPVTGWKREEPWSETGLTFIPPSPNIQNPVAALLYSGIGMFEATNVSVGRGTDTPFEHIGAPWMNGKLLAERLNQLKLPGVTFLPTIFSPEKDLYESRLCSGVRIVVIDPQQVRPVDLFAQIACLLRELSPKDFQLRWLEVARVTGSQDFEHLYQQNRPAAEILEVFHKSAEQFLSDRKAFLLY